jgi:protein AbiQ
MKFYFVSEAYTAYLRAFEPKIMFLTNNEKFILGIVLNIGAIKYYAPISSVKAHQLKNSSTLEKRFRYTCIPIVVENFGKEEIISLIRLDFMFPVPDDQLRELIIGDIKDYKYRMLVQKEYMCIIQNTDHILQQAQLVYLTALKPTHIFHRWCCDFKKLETKYEDWLNSFEEKIEPSPL